MTRRLLFCAALCLVDAAQGHEIGTTRVSVLFHEGMAYDIQIATDATALAEKLQAFSGASTPVPSRPLDLKALLERSNDLFAQRVKLSFDGAAVRPEISYAVEPPVDALSATAAYIRLKGQIPPGARQFTWTFAWTFASYALIVRNAENENPSTQWLEGGDPSQPIALNAPVPRVNRLQTAFRYLTLGFTHILPYGFDHVLFVLGIYLLCGRARAVLWQVSAFTIAHSITLGLSMYGIVSASPRVVEPMIAISIAYVAIENIFLSELKSWRIALVFGFGLLHGMGFAGALKELGLPRSEFLTALLTFNAGVELGQLAVIGTAFLLVGWHYSDRLWYRSRIVVPASAMIACMAVYWTVQRLHAGSFI